MDANEQEVRIRPYGENILLAGTSGSGKSNLAATLLQGLSEAQYSFCVIAVDGTYEAAVPEAVILGSSERPASVQEVLKLFRTPDQSGIITLSGLPVAERNSFFGQLLPHLSELRTRTGRPHWLVIDSEHAPAQEHLTPSVLQITSRPNLLERSALATVNLVLATGDSPQQIIREFCQMTATPTPALDPISLRAGEALAWHPQARNAAPVRLKIKHQSVMNVHPSRVSM